MELAGNLKKKLDDVRAEREARRKMLQKSTAGSVELKATPPPAGSEARAGNLKSTPPPKRVAASTDAASKEPPPSLVPAHRAIKKDEDVDVVPRNGFDMLRAWDKTELEKEAEKSVGPSLPTKAISHGVGVLSPASVFKNHLRNNDWSFFPSVSDIAVTSMALKFRPSASGSTNQATAAGVVGPEREAGASPSHRTSLSAGHESSAAVVVAASYATFERSDTPEIFHVGKGDEPNGPVPNKASFDRTTSHSGFTWGSSHSASATHSRASPKFGSEVDQFLIGHSAGLVLVWTFIPAVLNEVQQQGEGFTGSGSAKSVSDIVVVVPLVCDAEVKTILLSPKESGVLYGGTATGRVVAWNFLSSWSHLSILQLRSCCMEATGTPHTLVLPCQRPSSSSFPSPEAGILKLALLEEAGNTQLYAIRQDGSVTSWFPQQLLRPTGTRRILKPPASGVAVNSAAFAMKAGVGEVLKRVFVGTSRGAVLEGTIKSSEEIFYAARNVSSGKTLSKEGPAVDAETTAVGPMIVGIHSQAQHAKDLLAKDSSLLTCDVDGVGRLWGGEAVSAPPVTLLQSDITAVRWSPVDPHLFATGSKSGAVFLWHLESSMALTPQCTVTPTSVVDDLSHLSSAVQPLASVSVLRSAGGSGSVGSWHGTTGDAGKPYSSSVVSAVTFLQFSDDGRWLFCGYDGGNVKIIRLEEDVLRFTSAKDQNKKP